MEAETLPFALAIANALAGVGPGRNLHHRRLLRVRSTVCHHRQWGAS